jgi:hypothetical protein
MNSATGRILEAWVVGSVSVLAPWALPAAEDEEAAGILEESGEFVNYEFYGAPREYGVRASMQF